MAYLPTVEESIKSAMAKIASVKAEALPSETNAKLLKLAAAINDLPEPQATFADIYAVKEAICGR